MCIIGIFEGRCEICLGLAACSLDMLVFDTGVKAGRNPEFHAERKREVSYIGLKTYERTEPYDKRALCGTG